MATIKDVARKAGVSIATVSNVMNGKVSADSEKFRLVQEAAKELNYHPNYNARNLRKGKTKIIGVVLPELEAPYDTIFKGFSMGLGDYNYFPIMRISNNEPILEKKILQTFLDMGVSGIMIVPTTNEPNEMYHEIKKRNIPLVIVERKINNFDCNYVVFDNRTQIQRQMNMLKKTIPVEQIALIHREGYLSCDEDCRAGFLYEKGNENNIFSVSAKQDEAFKQIIEILSRKDDAFRAVITSNQGLAIAFHEAASMFCQDIEIYALSEEKWNQQEIYKKIRIIKRDILQAGVRAGQIMSDISGQDARDVQTYYLKRRKDEPAPIPYISENYKELRILALSGEATDVMENLALSFAKSSNIHVLFEKKSYKELRLALDQEMKSDVCHYDLVMIDKPWLPYFTAGDFLYELRKDLGQEVMKKYPQSIRKSFYAFDQRRCVLPVISSVQAIYYRKDIFEDLEIKGEFQKKYGIPLTPPRSWKEYNRICEFFTREFNPDSPFAYGTSLSTGDNNALVSEFYPRQWAFDGNLVDRWGDIVLHEDGSVRALDNLRETYRYSKHEKKYATMDEEMFYGILHGEVPMVLGYASHYSPRKYKEETYEHFIGTTSVPKGYSMLGGYSLGVNRKSYLIPEACEYLRWMISDPISIANMRMNGCIPTLAVFENTELQMKYPWLRLVEQVVIKDKKREQIFTADGRQLLPEVIDQILGETVRSALHTEESSIDILYQAEEKIMDLINEGIETF